MAVYEKRTQFVELILQNAIDKEKLLKQKDIYGNTALHLSVIQNSSEMTKVLLSFGASRYCKTKVILECYHRTKRLL